MRWLAIALAAVIGAVILYKTAYPSVTLRYRLTLEAEVDGQPKTGSGIIEVTYSKQPEIAAQRELSIGYRGEAIVLDLGDRGKLFALLKAGADSRSGPEWIVLRAFDLPGGSFPRPVEEGVKQVGSLSGKRELPLESLPFLVRFRNINDPMTVERVGPLNIAERFGAGTKLVRATLEIVPAGIWPLNAFGVTGEPVTTGIQERLNWLHRLNGGYLDGAFAGGGPALPNVLHGGNFKMGM